MQERAGLPSMASMVIPCLELSSSSNVERLSPSFAFWIVIDSDNGGVSSSHPGPSFYPPFRLLSFGSGSGPANHRYFIIPGRRAKENPMRHTYTPSSFKAT